ncbi:MAG: transcription elongation factor GreA [Fimbriimonadia bacterium]|nr:transcription elongation factor GreA [Fimbriimonadia bacterium]
MTDILLTPEGHKKLSQELEELKLVKRPEIADTLRQARALGDLRENFAYDDAKRQQAIIEGRIKDLQKILEIAKVVQKPDNADGVTAHLGSLVTLRDVDSSNERKLMLVGSFEADPLQDRISIVSPVGAAIIGKLLNETVEVQTPKGVIRYQIIAIE